MTRLVRMLVLCALFALAPLSLFAGSATSVGSAAPEFTLNSQEGTPVSLKDYHGRWVVLYFYPEISLAAAPSKRTTSSATCQSTRRRRW